MIIGFYRAAEGPKYDASFAQASIMRYRPSPVTAAHLGQPRAADAAAGTTARLTGLAGGHRVNTLRLCRLP